MPMTCTSRVAAFTVYSPEPDVNVLLAT